MYLCFSLLDDFAERGVYYKQSSKALFVSFPAAVYMRHWQP